MAGKTHSVSYYDVLGVERDATPAQIKQAWREATDKFEPGSGSGQFRLFGDAADTLLDPDRRAAYDAELDGEATDADAATTTLTRESPAVAGKQAEDTADDRTDLRTQKKAERQQRRDEQKAARASRTPVERRPLTRRAIAVGALLTLLTVAVVVAAATLWSKQHSAAESEDAGDQASAAAERSLPAVLSYDYQNLKADRARAVPFLSDSYRKEYTTTFDQLIESPSPGQPSQAEQLKAVVKATVENVGVANAEPNRVRLVVFLNQATTKNGGTPTFSLNRLVVTMTHSGNSWLVDNIVSY